MNGDAAHSKLTPSAWPRISGLGPGPAERQAAGLLWGVMATAAPVSGRCNIYDRFPYYREQSETERRRPVVDEILDGGRRPASGPRVILRHDVDGIEGFDRWAEWEEERGLRSVNLLRAPALPDGDLQPGYVMPPPDYDIEDSRLGETIRAGLERGCEFGLHYASARPEVVRCEAGRLREALGPCGVEGPLPASAHWLQSSGETLRELDRRGFGFDFSFMDYASYALEDAPEDVPHHPGFPTGTTHPHLLYDPLEARWLGLVAVPGALEEVLVCGLTGMTFSEEGLGTYLGYFERYGGVLVLNWHGERIDLAGPLAGLVRRLRDEGFEFVTTRDLKHPGKPPRTDAIGDPRLP